MGFPRFEVSHTNIGAPEGQQGLGDSWSLATGQGAFVSQVCAGLGLPAVSRISLVGQN